MGKGSDQYFSIRFSKGSLPSYSDEEKSLVLTKQSPGNPKSEKQSPKCEGDIEKTKHCLLQNDDSVTAVQKGKLYFVRIKQ